VLTVAPDPVRELVAREAGLVVPAAFHAIGEAARARFAPAARAVLLYGSCLRDGQDRDRLVDLYVLLDDSTSGAERPLLRALGALLPPNVYHLATPFEGRTVRAKVAVVGLARLERLVSPQTLEPYFWARLAQPVRLLWAADPAVEARVHALLAQSVRTLVAAVRPLLGTASDPLVLFERAFHETYRTELRAERPGRATLIVTADAARYERLGRLCLAGSPPPGPEERTRAVRLWARRRRLGKLRSVLRLAKAAFTFEGGADYLAWKIERHSGERIELTAWQRRHPILAGLLLLPRLRRRGAVR
jgi:hypothetical protein